MKALVAALAVLMGGPSLACGLIRPEFRPMIHRLSTLQLGVMACKLEASVRVTSNIDDYAEHLEQRMMVRLELIQRMPKFKGTFKSIVVCHPNGSFIRWTSRPPSLAV